MDPSFTVSVLGFCRLLDVTADSRQTVGTARQCVVYAVEISVACTNGTSNSAVVVTTSMMLQLIARRHHSTATAP